MSRKMASGSEVQSGILPSLGPLNFPLSTLSATVVRGLRALPIMRVCVPDFVFAALLLVCGRRALREVLRFLGAGWAGAGAGAAESGRYSASSSNIKSSSDSGSTYLERLRVAAWRPDRRFVVTDAMMACCRQ